MDGWIHYGLRMQQLNDLETPALVLDRGILERNIEAMNHRLEEAGAALRPHLKTCKSMDVARLVMKPPARGITVSTLHEAEYFFDHGIVDILYAIGIAPNKLARVAGLRRRGADLKVVVDHPDGAAFVARAAERFGAAIPALIEIDCDGRRAGMEPGHQRLLETGRILGGNLRGVMSHGGGSYQCRTIEEIAAVAESERASTVAAAEALGAAGMTCGIVSVGSTPTAWFARSREGVTEVRAGVHLFQDLVMAGLGVCEVGDIAISVLATVIGHQPDKGWLLTDAGWMALSRDRGTSAQAEDLGYGLVCDLDGAPLGDLIVSDANQEHGIVTSRGGKLDCGKFPLGTMLRVLPNHACATAAQFGCYQVVEGSREVIANWPRINGW